SPQQPFGALADAPQCRRRRRKRGSTCPDRRKLRAVDPVDEAAGQEVQGDPASSLESARSRPRPMKAERRTALIKSIARGRAWLDEIVSGTASIEAIAARQKCSVRHVNMTISMAFIAPALVKAAVEGRLPRGIGIATLRDAPAEWSLQ